MLSEFVIESIFTVFLTGNNQIGGKDGIGAALTSLGVLLSGTPAGPILIGVGAGFLAQESL